MIRSGIIGILLCCITITVSSAQDVDEGRVEIVQDKSIDTILMKHVELNKQLLEDPDNYGIDGFRIQIFEESGNRSSTHAREVMAEFTEQYPDIPVYLTWQAPNFKVRVGDFSSRMQAEGYLKKDGSRIHKGFPLQK